ncbi:hypothetical protein, partial [Helicobacter sp. 11S03491-1]|uniref:hypothetical protein n=1 Tax=Helicobacter sp. 11S03491-1 TaxID=1476196 RepID=UPI0015DA4B05
GINSILTDHWRVYADVDAGFLGTHYQQNYLVSIGGRYAFGKKAAVNKKHNISTGTDEKTINPDSDKDNFDKGL